MGTEKTINKQKQIRLEFKLWHKEANLLRVKKNILHLGENVIPSDSIIGNNIGISFSTHFICL